MSNRYGGEYTCDYCGNGWAGAEMVDEDGKDWCGECCREPGCGVQLIYGGCESCCLSLFRKTDVEVGEQFFKNPRIGL